VCCPCSCSFVCHILEMVWHYFVFIYLNSRFRLERCYDVIISIRTALHRGGADDETSHFCQFLSPDILLNKSSQVKPVTVIHSVINNSVQGRYLDSLVDDRMPWDGMAGMTMRGETRRRERWNAGLKWEWEWEKEYDAGRRNVRQCWINRTTWRRVLLWYANVW
jgi:hypothetical protein